MGLLDNLFSHTDATTAHAELYGMQGPIQEHHKAKFTQEFISAAVGYEAMKQYENHARSLGKPVDHERMKVRHIPQIYLRVE
jgi:hypothetical protein